jgi:hypothetical protein
MKVCAFVAVLCACPFPTAQELKKPDYLIRITETELSADGKPLKPGVDFQIVRFKIERKDNYYAHATVEMWSDGERIDRPKYGYGEASLPDEVRMTWHFLPLKDKPDTVFVYVLGVREFGRDIKIPQSKQEMKTRFGPIAIPKSVELKSEDSSAVVWALGAMGDGKVADLNKPEEVERMLKTAAWVMILRISPRKNK